jgi:hypothetical protein
MPGWKTICTNTENNLLLATRCDIFQSWFTLTVEECTPGFLENRDLAVTLEAYIHILI